MKLALLMKQLHLFKDHGITKADVRLGYDVRAREMGIEDALREVSGWKHRDRIGDGEISVKPCLPRCWTDAGGKF
jgi:hypothetical protein